MYPLLNDYLAPFEDLATAYGSLDIAYVLKELADAHDDITAFGDSHGEQFGIKFGEDKNAYLHCRKGWWREKLPWMKASAINCMFSNLVEDTSVIIMPHPSGGEWYAVNLKRVEQIMSNQRTKEDLL